MQAQAVHTSPQSFPLPKNGTHYKALLVGSEGPIYKALRDFLVTGWGIEIPDHYHRFKDYECGRQTPTDVDVVLIVFDYCGQSQRNSAQLSAAKANVRCVTIPFRASACQKALEAAGLPRVEVALPTPTKKPKEDDGLAAAEALLRKKIAEAPPPAPRPTPAPVAAQPTASPAPVKPSSTPIKAPSITVPRDIIPDAELAKRLCREPGCSQPSSGPLYFWRCKEHGKPHKDAAQLAKSQKSVTVATPTASGGMTIPQIVALLENAMRNTGLLDMTVRTKTGRVKITIEDLSEKGDEG
jgi:hypothetical protein